MRRLAPWTLVLAGPALAAPPPITEADDHVVVEGKRTLVGGVRVTVADGPATAVHLGDSLEATPGVSLVRRGADASDPVLRGLSGDRVQTRVGVVPVHGACPSRMDPPVTYLGPTAAREAVVELGAPSVRRGGAATGGRIAVPVELKRSPEAAAGPTAWIEGRWDQARAGGALDAAVEGRLGPVDYRVAGGASILDDYESADGVRVPAGRTEWTGTGAVSWAASANQRLWTTFTYAGEADVDTPALPMDIDESTLALLNAGWRLDLGGALRQVSVEAGFGLVDHVMSNADKPNRARMAARTPASADSYAASVTTRWALGWGTLVTGFDAQRVARDATRTRHLVASGKTFADHIWPEVSQQEVGAFADLTVPLPAALSLSVGVRGGVVRSDAAATHDPSLGGKSIAEHYVGFYGEGAADVAADDGVGGARLALSWSPVDLWSASFSSGVTTAAADVNSRFFAFAPAPGGFQVGNPTLSPERRWTLDLGTELQTRFVDARAGAYLHQIEDFVLRTVLARRDVNGDGAEDRILGFHNTEARLWGGELAATIKPTARLSVPLSAAYVRGENTGAGRDLPEIPPLEFRAAARVSFPGSVAWWAEAGLRHVAEQARVDAQFVEDETPAFTTTHLRAGVSAWGARLVVGVENLFDVAYHEHLSREAMLPVGDLRAGDEVQAPGRRFFVRVRGQF